MAKIRDLSSIESGLAQAIKNLGKGTLESVTGKSESFLRKCSDPDLDQQLDHRDAIKIDKACIEAGLMPYLFRAHEYVILSELKKVKGDNTDLNELLIKFTILHGKLMDSIKSAKSNESDRGNRISAGEKKEIFEAFDQLEAKILKIKKTIETV